MKRRLFGIYGASGCGRGIMPIAAAAQQDDDTAVFIDDRLQGTRVNGHEVVSFETFCSGDRFSSYESRMAVIAIADPKIRRELATRCRDADIGAFDVVAPSAIRMDDVIVGPGALISPFVVMTSNIRIGCHFHANIQSYVEHDCVIGDYVTFAPGVRCNGNVHIADGAYIGSGAIIRQGTPRKPLTIGRGAIVGMGAVVLNDVPDGAVMVGNPARPIRR